MAKKDYSNLTKEQLLEVIEKLEGKKKYGLVWDEERVPEKVVIDCQDKLPVLTEVKDKEITTDENEPTHILIEGDNYHALSVLNYTHKGKIDLIYIDPPYNTGNNDFIYNDRYVDKNDTWRHSKWLSFISKRLDIAYQLLTDDGLLFISIDDNEIAQLKCLCDSIFNHSSKSITSNCLGVLVWDLGTGTQAGHFVRAHEYVLAYTKNKNLLPNFSGGEGIIDHSALKKISKKNPPVQYTFKAGTKFLANDGVELTGTWGGSEKTTLISGKMMAENQMLKYDVTLEAGFAMISQMKSWFDGKDTIDSKGQKVIDFYFNSTGVLHYKKERSIINPPTVIKDTGSTKTGTTELENILGRAGTFGYPKPKDLIKYLLGLKSNVHTILDFFAGSGTTMHATMELNKKDNGHRQCILITNNENKICEEVTYPRISKVMKGYENLKGEKIEGLGNNLKYFKTSFVANNRNKDQLKIDITRRCTEMLCLKEGIFNLLKEEADYKIFQQGSRYLAVYYDFANASLDELKDVMNTLKGEKVLYCFTVDTNGLDKANFSDWKNIRLEQIPQKILDVYSRLFI